MKSVLLLALFASLIQFGATDDNCKSKENNVEARLRAKLMCNYDTSARPVKNSNDTVNVDLILHILQFEYSHEFASSEHIQINGWLYARWNDEFLTWDPKDYDGLDSTMIGGWRIWTPKFMHKQNSRDSSTSIYTPCSLSYDGVVICYPSIQEKMFCVSDYANWPHDVQNCTFSLTNGHGVSGTKVNLRPRAKNSISTHSMLSNRFWKLLEKNTWKNSSSDDFIIYYSVLIKRQTSMLFTRIFIPAFVLLAMSLLALSLNIQSWERMAVLFFGVISHFILNNNMEYYIPESGTTEPKICLYFRDATILTCAILCETIFLKNVFKYTIETPGWIVTIINLTNTKAGRVIYHEFDPDTIISPGADTEALTSSENKLPNIEWKKFALIFDRTFCILTMLLYFTFIIKYLI